jgi:hypothetical protein
MFCIDIASVPKLVYGSGVVFPFAPDTNDQWT